MRAPGSASARCRYRSATTSRSTTRNGVSWRCARKASSLAVGKGDDGTDAVVEGLLTDASTCTDASASDAPTPARSIGETAWMKRVVAAWSNGPRQARLGLALGLLTLLIVATTFPLFSRVGSRPMA